jgi:5-methylcytosine-specific restriction endonuclease McrA
MSNRVFVLSRTKKSLMPCTPKRGRKLLTAGRAAVYRMKPFTIILKDREDGETQPIEFKTDPGSRTTGIVLVGEFKRGRAVIWAANLHHRGSAIRANLESRRSLRRGRRGRKTRYRPARFLNRSRPVGWLPPSLMSRVGNLRTWYARLLFLTPITEAHLETVRFDMQLMVNPEISGIQYQQGELAGFEVREYLLEKWGRTCTYCDARNVLLEIEHIHARSNGGSNRVSNLTLACVACNQRKGNRNIRDFLAADPARLARIQAHARAPLRDAAAVNATRYAIGDVLKSFGLPVSFWSGGRTKHNRTHQGYPKDHFIDAACVGETGAAVHIADDLRPINIKATGRGTRQVVRTDRYGFPRSAAGRCKRVHGFQTGDYVRLEQPTGQYAGIHVGRLASIRASGYFDIKTPHGKVTANYRHYQLMQRSDGYEYQRSERAS